MRVWLEPWQRDPRRGLVVLVAGAAIAALLLLVAAVLLTPGFVAFDTAASAAIRSVHFPGSRTIALVSSFIGGFWPMAALTVITAAWLLRRGHRTGSVAFVVTMAGGTLVGALGKLIVARTRPGIEAALIPLPESYGFPSGHALASLLYFGSIAVIILSSDAPTNRKIWGAFGCAVMAFAIGMSRVVLGVHYGADVVAGWILGIAWLAIVMLVAIRWGSGVGHHDRGHTGRMPRA